MQAAAVLAAVAVATVAVVAEVEAAVVIVGKLMHVSSWISMEGG